MTFLKNKHIILYLTIFMIFGCAIKHSTYTLEDIEKHFEKYGIDFGKANDARPTLINQLKAMGLLSGSPDAGGSVAVICPYT